MSEPTSEAGQLDRPPPNGAPVHPRRRSSDRDAVAPRRIDDARQKSEADLFELAAVGIAQVDPASKKILRANRRFCDMLGYTAEELYRSTFLEIAQTEDVELNLAQFERVLTGETAEFSLEKRFVRKDGAIVWALVNVAMRHDSRGTTKCVVVVAQEITERKRVEEELRVQRELIATIVDAQPSGVALIRGEDLTFRFVNPAYQAIAPGKSMLGRTVGEVWPESQPAFEARCRRILETGAPHYALDQLWPMRRSHDGPLETAHFSWSIHRVRLPGESNWGLLISVWETTELKRTEEKLRESEERLRRAIGIETVGVLFFNTDGLVVDANDAFLRLSGYDRSDVEQRRVRLDRMTPPEWLPQSLKAIEEVRSFGRTVPVEKEYLRKDGSRWWALFAATRLSANEGAAFLIDITEAKQAEECLRASEERLAADLQAMRDLHALTVRLHAAANLRVALDEILSALLKLHQTDMGSVQLYDTQTRTLSLVGYRGFSREFAERYGGVAAADAGAYGLALQTGERLLIEDVVQHPALDTQAAASFGYRAVQCTPLRAPHGELLGLISTHYRMPRRWSERELRMTDLYARQAENIIGRMRADESLRESEARFRTMADGSPIMIWVVDAEGRVEFLNRTYHEFFGIAEGDAGVFDWPSVLHPDDRNAYVAAFTTAMRERRPLLARARVRRADGQWRWIESRGNPRVDTTGRVTGYIGSSPDVTDLYEMQQALREADRHKDEFLAFLGHELRNPLSAIRYSLGTLRLGVETSSSASRSYELIERQLAHVMRLANDLLEASRVAAGKIDLNKERIDLRVVIQDSVEASRAQIESLGHRLDVELCPQALLVDADRDRLAQVFGNLLSNAAKYMDPGGDIWLRCMQKGNEAVVSIRDTGVGIPPEMLGRIFDLFKQLDGSRRRAGGGLGIGLTLVRNLTELHGGSVQALSEGVGKGSEFIVRLPLAAI